MNEQIRDLIMRLQDMIYSLSTRIRELERVENQSDESTDVLKVQIFS